MSFIFYILQLLCPSQYASMGVEAPVLLYERSYNQQVHIQAEKVCLARIVFNESTSESLLGKKLVAQVTINRVKSGEFQDSICGAMKAKGAYSFYNPKSKKSIDKHRKYPVEYTKIAEEALAGKYEKLISNKVVYFKNCKHYNSFFETLVFVKKEKRHCFYRNNDIQLARR